jgi:hypothetical protein
MNPARPVTSIYFLKFLECLLVSVAIANILYMQVFFTITFAHKQPEIMNIIFDVAAVLLLSGGIGFTIGYSIYWHRKERQGSINSGRLHAWFRGLLRYWLALQITSYGIAKIFGLQFGHSYLRDDTLVSALSGFELTWNFFGYSYALTVIIGVLQIGGSVLLVFRRTYLLGIVILLPVMINILLIDIFYSIPFGATINAALFTLGLLYLLLLKRKELTAFFLRPTDNLPPVRLGIFKPLLKVAGLAFILTFTYYGKGVRSSYSFIGKWQVDTLVRNGLPVDQDAWLHDSTVWKHVYVEQYGNITFSPNPFVIEKSKARSGEYDYDTAKHVMKLRIYGDDGFLMTYVTIHDARHMQWKIVDYKDTTILHLSKVEKNGSL